MALGSGYFGEYERGGLGFWVKGVGLGFIIRIGLWGMP